ncbi:MAG: choice-of-anchor tandem repeat GloVer-containing protein [Terriglobales bacterium]
MLRSSARKLLFALFLSALTSVCCAADTFKTLIVFDGTDGATPVDTSLVQGPDGNLYGTTLGGGTNGAGTVFKMTPAGNVTILYSFCSLAKCADGALPYAGLVLASDGNFYGTTSQGGTADGISGTVFRITPTGTLTTLHSFDNTDGADSSAPLLQAANGDLYGIAEHGGSFNAGTFFKITMHGAFTSLYNFAGGDLNAPLLQATDGNFYSTSESAGDYGYGMIFKLTPSGHFSILHSFDSTDGSAPACGLLQASDGGLYGTTYQGGSNNSCENGCGTVFKITLAGALTTLHNFDGTDGSNPIAALIQATDGNFYGTTYAGGTAGDWGTVFKMTPTGKVTTLHSFAGTDGAQPYGPVSQDTSGNLYGTATNGTGAAASGTAFFVSTRLEPFVAFVRNRGKVHQTVGILGQGLTGTTAVSFGDVAAAFKVQSDTYLTATVPVGATSGYVAVTTPTAALKSNVPFQVLP